jgi:hypothetical protein
MTATTLRSRAESAEYVAKAGDATLRSDVPERSRPANGESA